MIWFVTSISVNSHQVPVLISTYWILMRIRIPLERYLDIKTSPWLSSSGPCYVRMGDTLRVASRYDMVMVLCAVHGFHQSRWVVYIDGLAQDLDLAIDLNAMCICGQKDFPVCLLRCLIRSSNQMYFSFTYTWTLTPEAGIFDSDRGLVIISHSLHGMSNYSSVPWTHNSGTKALIISASPVKCSICD